MEELKHVNLSIKNVLHQILIFDALLVCHYDSEISQALLFAIKKYDMINNDLSLVKNINIDDELSEFKKYYNQITNDYETLIRILDDIKDQLYCNFRAATLVILDNKQNDDLREFVDNLKTYCKMNNGFNNTSRKVYHDAYLEVKVFIEYLLKELYLIKDERLLKLLPISDLENVKDMEVFYMKDWMNLFNKIKFSIKYANIDNQELKTMFKQIEMYYFIIVSSDLIN